jgi:hypothetical protein
MTDEQNIPGVPEGWRVVAIRVPVEGKWVVGSDGRPYQCQPGYGPVAAIIEPIPKPKKRVLVAEWDLRADEDTAIPAVLINSGKRSQKCLSADRTRIEERDAD